ncbi:hypothetical protein DH09_14005 [Bacillaceae bacterium JMAK1]|nr:hypothetical protein DH09_14005 [Bacillaceae bacterium JMAK1]
MKKYFYSLMTTGLVAILAVSQASANEDVEQQLSEIEEKYNVTIEVSDSDMKIQSDAPDAFSNLKELEETAQLLNDLEVASMKEETDEGIDAQSDFGILSGSVTAASRTFNLNLTNFDTDDAIPININFVFDYGWATSTAAAGHRFTSISNESATSSGVEVVTWSESATNSSFVSSGGDSQGAANITTTGQWVASGDLSAWGGGVDVQISTDVLDITRTISPQIGS